MQTIKASWSGIRIMTIKRIDRGSECARRYQRETGPFPSLKTEGNGPVSQPTPFPSFKSRAMLLYFVRVDLISLLSRLLFQLETRREGDVRISDVR